MANQKFKQIVECTQPWYVKLKQDNGVQYNRVVLWGLFEEGETGDRYRFASPLIIMDGVPTEGTSFKNYVDTVYYHGLTEEVIEGEL